MDSAEPHADGDGDLEGAQNSQAADEDGEAGRADAGNETSAEDADDEGGAPRPTLQQRFSPFVTIVTTVHPQGLVIQLNRLFRQRVAAVSYERLVLDPTTIVSLRPGLLWTAGVLCGLGLLAALPNSPLAGELLPTLGRLSVRLPAWLAPGLLAAGMLALLLAVCFRRRMTLFLDREAGLHPGFLRDGADDAQVAEFVLSVRRAIIGYRCRPPQEEDSSQPAPPRLVATLDALLSMRQQELLTGPELEHFRELALRR